MKRGRLKQNTKGKGNNSIRLMLMQKQHSSYKSKSTTSSLLIETLKGKSINLASKCANPWKNYNKIKTILKRNLPKISKCWKMKTLVPLSVKLQRRGGILHGKAAQEAA